MACSTVFYSLGTREVFPIEFSTGTRSDKQIFGFIPVRVLSASDKVIQLLKKVSVAFSDLSKVCSNFFCG